MKKDRIFDAARAQLAVFVFAAVVVVLGFIFVATKLALAQHEAGGSTNAPQNFITHDAIAVVAANPAVKYLDSNPARVSLLCQTSTGEVNIGDASTDLTHGIVLSTTRFMPSIKIDNTDAIWVYSAGGVSAFRCSEVVRP